MNKYTGKATAVIDFSFSMQASSVEEAVEEIIYADWLEFELKDSGNKIFDSYEVEDWCIAEATTPIQIQNLKIQEEK